MNALLGFEPSDEEIPDHVIDGAEMLFGVKYPATYRQLIREFSGSYGDVDFRVDRPSPGFDYCSVGLILSLLPCSSESVYGTLSTWPEHDLSGRIIPFGVDGGGNYVCFDYRESEVPQIVLYFHELPGEDGIMRVCDTFDEFLGRLRMPAEED